MTHPIDPLFKKWHKNYTRHWASNVQREIFWRMPLHVSLALMKGAMVENLIKSRPIISSKLPSKGEQTLISEIFTLFNESTKFSEGQPALLRWQNVMLKQLMESHSEAHRYTIFLCYFDLGIQKSKWQYKDPQLSNELHILSPSGEIPISIRFFKLHCWIDDRGVTWKITCVSHHKDKASCPIPQTKIVEGFER